MDTKEFLISAAFLNIVDSLENALSICTKPSARELALLWRWVQTIPSMLASVVWLTRLILPDELIATNARRMMFCVTLFQRFFLVFLQQRRGVGKATAPGLSVRYSLCRGDFNFLVVLQLPFPGRPRVPRSVGTDAFLSQNFEAGHPAKHSFTSAWPRPVLDRLTTTESSDSCSRLRIAWQHPARYRWRSTVASISVSWYKAI